MKGWKHHEPLIACVDCGVLQRTERVEWNKKRKEWQCRDVVWCARAKPLNPVPVQTSVQKPEEPES